MIFSFFSKCAEIFRGFRRKWVKVAIEIFTLYPNVWRRRVWKKSGDKKKRRARALEMAEAGEGRVEAEISCKERKSELVRYLGKWLKGGERR